MFVYITQCLYNYLLISVFLYIFVVANKSSKQLRHSFGLN